MSEAVSPPQPMFSLILATYGRAEVLDLLIDSLEAQSCRDFEVIVADQNPDDRVMPYIERCRALGMRVVHVKLDKPNLSAARNRALERATGQWIAFPDDDCWYEPDALAVVESQAHSHVDGLVINWVEQTAAGQIREPDARLDYERWKHFRLDDASSITLFVRTRWARQVAGFDERLGVGQFFGSGEETDFVLRLLREGAAIFRNPAARVHHRFGVAEDGCAPSSNLVKLRARGTGAIYAKHRMSVFVIARGLLSPLVRTLLRRGTRDLALAWAIVRGRWQGWRRWSDG